ncbi:hypothetical protein ACM1ZW_20895 [Pseudomonas sp. NFX71]|uniref:hypothetical protein n=1 Tax=Pseudomonas sp. NFX71 TaxID=3399121 RepID=UPI003A8AE34F
MRSEDEVLVKNLSARLSEEIANLPKEGKDHPLTVKIKGNRGHINLGSYTQQCTHCDHNPRNHHHIAAQPKQPARTEKGTAQLLKIAAFLGVALLSYFVRDFLPST